MNDKIKILLMYFEKCADGYLKSINLDIETDDEIKSMQSWVKANFNKKDYENEIEKI